MLENINKNGAVKDYYVIVILLNTPEHICILTMAKTVIIMLMVYYETQMKKLNNKRNPQKVLSVVIENH